jgi:dipeptidase E
LWDGLGLIDYSFAPHYRSNHPESEMVEKAVGYMKNKHMSFKTLQDGEVVIDDVDKMPLGNNPV